MPFGPLFSCRVPAVHTECLQPALNGPAAHSNLEACFPKQDFATRNPLLTSTPATGSDGSRRILPESARVEIVLGRGAVAGGPGRCGVSQLVVGVMETHRAPAREETSSPLPCLGFFFTPLRGHLRQSQPCAGFCIPLFRNLPPRRYQMYS